MTRTEKAAREYDRAKTRLAAAIIDARREGASWSEIGRDLDMSKQAAQQKFGGMVAVALGGSAAPGEVTGGGTHRPLSTVEAYLS